VARELTKLHEQVRRGTPAELAQWAVGAPPRGEIVVLVGPPVAAAVTDEAIAAKLTPMLSEMSLSDAARAAADELGVAKARVYDIGIALKRPGDG
jgi:16S rRNA (cytidine1402-2'-O)-methyltransferase